LRAACDAPASRRRPRLAGRTRKTLAAPATAVELTMYYPVAVGGPLTKVVDGLVDDFMKENPDIKVSAIYAGNYNDARIKALAALKSGEPAQLSVMFSIDIYE
jgi:sn-glycerol 3-phosphate transport system substrate-binding protein